MAPKENIQVNLGQLVHEAYILQFDIGDPIHGQSGGSGELVRFAVCMRVAIVTSRTKKRAALR